MHMLTQTPPKFQALLDDVFDENISGTSLHSQYKTIILTSLEHGPGSYLIGNFPKFLQN
jgi:hypothetical protein